MELMAAPFELLTTHVAPDTRPPSLPVCLPVSKGDGNEAVMDEFSLCPSVLTSTVQARSFLASGSNCRRMEVLPAVVEGRKTTESEGWASQSLLGCAPSYDMPYPLSGHRSQDQEEAGSGARPARRSG